MYDKDPLRDICTAIDNLYFIPGTCIQYGTNIRFYGPITLFKRYSNAI